MIEQNNVICIQAIRRKVCYSSCAGLEQVPDVWIDIPETPVPGNRFAGEYFLPKEWRKKFEGMGIAFFVADVAHGFKEDVQLVTIILQGANKQLLDLAKSFKHEL